MFGEARLTFSLTPVDCIPLRILESPPGAKKPGLLIIANFFPICLHPKLTAADRVVYAAAARCIFCGSVVDAVYECNHNGTM